MVLCAIWDGTTRSMVWYYYINTRNVVWYYAQHGVVLRAIRYVLRAIRYGTTRIMAWYHAHYGIWHLAQYGTMLRVLMMMLRTCRSTNVGPSTFDLPFFVFGLLFTPDFLAFNLPPFFFLLCPVYLLWPGAGAGAVRRLEQQRHPVQYGSRVRRHNGL